MAKKNNPDHSTEIKRINRILGQLEGVKKMIEDKRYCYDILVQTKAITSALKSLEATILEKHLNHCVSSAFDSKNEKDSQEKIAELMEFFTKRMN